jgi:tetrahydromethanopterin S-methyltransferase subunit D
MGKLKHLGLGVLGLMLCAVCNAQEKPAMADVMRSNGKIYVVVAVCLTILIGLFLYVVSVDRKISKLEKENMQ